MKTAIALFIQFSIVAVVGFGVWYLLRVGEERASNTAPATPPAVEEVAPEEAPEEAPAGGSEPESLAKEEHVPPDLS